MAPLESHILTVILGRSKALPKIDIVHRCTWNTPITESQVRNALANLSKSRLIIELKVARHGKGDEDAKFYVVPNCSEAKRERCKRIIQDRLAKIVVPSVLRDTGQEYVRAIFRYLRDIRGDERIGPISAITFRRKNQKDPKQKKLGRILLPSPNDDGNKEYADILVGYTKFTLLIESKNQREPITFPSDELTKLIGQCLRNQMQPLLVCNRLDDEAKQFCQVYGIMFLELDRQILPSRVRAEAKNLYHPELLRDRFQFVSIERPLRKRSKDLDPRTLRDLELISGAQIEQSHERWMNSVDELRVIYRALMAKPMDRATLERLVPSELLN